jgi:hypothetical protein
MLNTELEKIRKVGGMAQFVVFPGICQKDPRNPTKTTRQVGVAGEIRNAPAPKYNSEPLPHRPHYLMIIFV